MCKIVFSQCGFLLPNISSGETGAWRVGMMPGDLAGEQDWLELETVVSRQAVVSVAALPGPGVVITRKLAVTLIDI